MTIGSENGEWTRETSIGQPIARHWVTAVVENEIGWIGERFTAIDSKLADYQYRKREMARLRKARERERYPERSKEHNHWAKPEHREHRDERRFIKKAERVFIVWDGEGPQDTGYSLLGNSEGMEICYPTLKTIDCLELIMETERKFPDAIHVGFGFDYDVSNILADLSWRHFSALKKFHRTVWRDYEIEHIPHKWFKIKHGMVTATIFDVYNFFMTSLVGALESWDIGPFSKTVGVSQPEVVMATVPPLDIVNAMTETSLVKNFKNLRSTFLWRDIAQIRVYMRLELKYTKVLIEQLRETFIMAGYLPNSWHGPGALARMALKKHNVYAAMAKTPPDVQIASRYGYIGGRFDPRIVGHIGGAVYSADRRSAYPYAATFLPNLSAGSWRRGRHFEPGKFAIYHISYEAKPDPFRIYPLPKRLSNGTVCWPYKVKSWYWSPEAELVANDPDATFIEAWIFDERDENDRPFKWLLEYYERRKLLKRIGNPAEYTFKLVINSVYGQLAQRAGWDRNRNAAPKSHQLEWAGFITSHCRAAVWKLANAVGEGKCISIDTDGIMATVPIPIPPDEVGEDLGQWETEEYEDGIFWQSGMYGLKKDGKWVKAKTRGIPRGTYEPEQMIAELERGNHTLRMTRHKFVGYGLAMSQKHLLNKWIDEDYEYLLGGNGKVIHNELLCKKVCDGDVHRLVNLNVLHWSAPESKAHYLPWLHAEAEMRLNKNIFQDLTLFDMNDNDEWEITNGANLRRSASTRISNR